MPNAVTVRFDNARLEALIAQLGSSSHDAVDETAESIRNLASQLSPRDTGSLSASIYVGTPNGSDYGEHASAARALNPNVQIAEEVRSEFVLSLSGGDDNLYVDVIGVAAGHGIFQELGTRYQSAQPYLFPAIESQRAEFVSRMRQIARD